jgi:N-carbamoyl-L-amino-acid hydrolase
MQATQTAFDALWASLAPIGRDPATGGVNRLPWTPAELACREWFRTQAASRSLDVEQDRNGNLWAWWSPTTERDDVVVTGSHLDSVVNGGAYDGALGVVCAFAAVDALRDAGAQPVRPLAVVSFMEEEGARFGRACIGSKLLTGLLDPAEARELRDDDGVRLGDVATGDFGAEPERLARIAAYLEVHVEQGRQLDGPLGVADVIWPHGRYRFDFHGEANHAGTTPLALRHDPMLDFARATIAARTAAEEHGGLATFGRVHVEPNITNAIPSLVRAWLDVRAADEQTVDAILRAVGGAPVRESWTPAVTFDVALRDLVQAPTLSTAAGHDAAILQDAGVPSAMIFVRNPTGVSHAPGEHADRDDCLAAVDALASALRELAC